MHCPHQILASKHIVAVADEGTAGDNSENNLVFDYHLKASAVDRAEDRQLSVRIFVTIQVQVRVQSPIPKSKVQVKSPSLLSPSQESKSKF